MLRKLSRVLFGYDVFISYPYSGGQTYARQLQQQLTNLDYEVFLDEEELPYGESLRSSLSRAIRRSHVLVLVGTRGALVAPYVNLEVQAALGLRRAIVPIDVEGIRTAAPWPELADVPWVQEPAGAAAEPSAAVLEQLRRLFRFRRRNTVTRRLTGAAATAFLILAIFALLQWREAVRQRGEAVAQRKVAEEQRNEAIVQRGIAQEQTAAARANLAATRYALANVESEERANPIKAFLHACAAVEAAPDADPLLDVYIRRAEQLALGIPRSLRVAGHADSAALSGELDAAVVRDQGRLRMADLRTGRAWDLSAAAPAALFTIPALSHDGGVVVAGTTLERAASWLVRRTKQVAVSTPQVVLRGTPQSRFYVSPDGRTALGWVGVETGDDDGQHVEAAWDAATGAARSTAALRTVFRFGRNTWSRNAARNWAVIVPAGISSGTPQLQVVDVTTGTPQSMPFGPTSDDSDIVSLAMSPNADWVVAVVRQKAANRYDLRVYSALDGTPATPPSVDAREPLRILDVSADGRRVLALGGEGSSEAKLQLWDFGRPSYPNPYRELGSVTTPRLWVNLAGSGRLENLARLAEDARVVVALSSPDLRVRTPDDQQALGQSSARLLLWDVDTARPIAPVIGIPGDVATWEVSRSGRRVGAITRDGTALLWDLVARARPGESRSDRVAAAAAARYDGGWLSANLQAEAYTQLARRSLTIRTRARDARPLVLEGVRADGPPGVLPLFQLSPDGTRYAIVADGLEVRAVRDGTLLRRISGTTGQRPSEFRFDEDGQHLTIASVATLSSGRAVLRVQQRDVQSGRATSNRTADVEVYGDGGRTQWAVGAIGASGRQFLIAAPGPIGGIQWSKVERIRIVDVEGHGLGEIAFRPESAAPPWLVATVFRAARLVSRQPDGTLTFDLPKVSIRMRVTGSGAVLERADTGRAILAPADPVDDAFAPAMSDDGAWVAFASPNRRVLRAWSTLTGLPSTPPLLESDTIFAAGFTAAGGTLVFTTGDGSSREIYMGQTPRAKPAWIARMGTALTGARLSEPGYSLVWLDDADRARERGALRELLTTGSATDRGAAFILERWLPWLADPSVTSSW